MARDEIPCDSEMSVKFLGCGPFFFKLASMGLKREMPGITLWLSIICFSVDQKDIVSLKDLQKPQINFVVCFSSYYNKQFGF